MNEFQHLKVVELASVLAGPAVGMFFAELGAEVIKIENKRTGGDTTRHWKLPEENPDDPASAYFHSVNWGKKSLFLDLNLEADAQLLESLLLKADVVVSNFKKGGANKLGLDFESLAQRHPRLILASINAYGDEDGRPGFDVAIQAETGWMYMNGEPGGPPVKMPVALMDLLAAHQLKEGILTALLRRERTGKGGEVSVSLFDTGIASLANQASNWLNAGHLPQRMGSRHPNISPYGDIFYSADQRPLILSVGTEQQFKALCQVLQAPQIAEDPRFANNSLRLRHRDALADLLAKAFTCFEADQLLAACQAAQVPIAPIRNLREVFEIPAAQQLVLTQENAEGPPSKSVRTAIFKLSPH